MSETQRHERIWLQSEKDADPVTGPEWCQDKVWPNDTAEHEPTEYVRADLYDRLERERDAQRNRGDNHWETLRSIRHIARESGDIERIIQWVDDAGSGYTETAEKTLAEVMDRAVTAEAERDAANAARVEAEGERDRVKEAVGKHASDTCEGWCRDGGQGKFNDCFGCKLYAALTPAPEVPTDGE